MSITIEHCINCKNHQWNTRHNQARYKDLYDQLAKEFQNLGYKVKAGDKPKLGSFEITLGEYLLFSKLQTGMFPDVETVVKFVDDFNKIPEKNKFSKYQQLKKKKNKKDLDQSRYFSARSVQHRAPTFSPMKHRDQLKQYIGYQMMSDVLSKTRREANYSVNKTSSVYNPSSTSRSRFMNQRQDKFRQTNPEWIRPQSKLQSKPVKQPEPKPEPVVNMRDPFQHDDHFISDDKSQDEQQIQKKNLMASNAPSYNNEQFQKQDSQEPKQNALEREQNLKDLQVNAQ